MADWVAKRFWTDVSVQAEDDGYSVRLDGRNVKTPLKRSLVVPTQGLAEVVADEWRAVDEIIDPLVMDFTRYANVAIDKVADQHTEVWQAIAAYGDSDLICYRADSPSELVERQNLAWNPMIEWAESHLGAKLSSVAGVMHVGQSPEALDRLAGHVRDLTPFELTGVYELVSLSGSLILGLAASNKWKTAQELWDLSRVDELWQIDQWGEDEQAQEAADVKKNAFLTADKFYSLVSDRT